MLADFEKIMLFLHKMSHFINDRPILSEALNLRFHITLKHCISFCFNKNMVKPATMRSQGSREIFRFRQISVVAFTPVVTVLYYF